MLLQYIHVVKQRFSVLGRGHSVTAGGPVQRFSICSPKQMNGVTSSRRSRISVLQARSSSWRVGEGRSEGVNGAFVMSSGPATGRGPVSLRYPVGAWRLRAAVNWPPGTTHGAGQSTTD